MAIINVSPAQTKPDQMVPSGLLENPSFGQVRIATFGTSSSPHLLAYNPSQRLLALAFPGYALVIGNCTELKLKLPKECVDLNISALHLTERYCMCTVGKKVIIFNIATSEENIEAKLDNIITASCATAGWVFVSSSAEIETIHIVDGQISDYNIPNPTASSASVVCITINPFDSNVLLVAYSNGIAIVWDLKCKSLISKKEYSCKSECVGAAWCPTTQHCFVVAY
jgi:WD40 repeat protein